MFEAHEKSVFRGNPSTVAFKVAFDGSGSYTQAVISALSTLGHRHGPIVEAYAFLNGDSPRESATRMLTRGVKVPGWGTSFDDDQIWKPVDSILRSHFPAMAIRLDDVTKVLHTAGKMIHPNPSAYTAATAIIIELPKELAPWIFVQGRLAAWSSLALKGTV